MANEDSFFMRAKVKKERLEEFLAQKPLEPTIDDNWLKWAEYEKTVNWDY